MYGCKCFVFIPSKCIFLYFAISKLMNINTIYHYKKTHFLWFYILWMRRNLKILHTQKKKCKINHMIDSLIWNVVVSLCCYQELDKLRTENKDMRTDMLKMAKQHQKLQHKLKDLVEFEKTKKLLEAMAFYVCTCQYCSNVHIS